MKLKEALLILILIFSIILGGILVITEMQRQSSYIKSVENIIIEKQININKEKINFKYMNNVN